MAVVGIRAQMGHLGALDEDRDARKVEVPARVVAVEVTVRDHAYIRGADAVLGQHRPYRPDVHRSEGLDGLPVRGGESGVEQEQTLGMRYEERRDDDPIVGEARIGRRHRVVAGVQRPDPRQLRSRHVAILTYFSWPRA